MARTPQDVTDAELSVLQLLWEFISAAAPDYVDNKTPADPPDSST